MTFQEGTAAPPSLSLTGFRDVRGFCLLNVSFVSIVLTGSACSIALLDLASDESRRSSVPNSDSSFTHDWILCGYSALPESGYIRLAQPKSDRYKIPLLD